MTQAGEVFLVWRLGGAVPELVGVYSTAERAEDARRAVGPASVYRIDRRPLDPPTAGDASLLDEPGEWYI